ncbi:MAG: hypothetical protein J6M34_07620 [Clostridia bacterium]|nr:hypothetical protein [Clostridia bacterium]
MNYIRKKQRIKITAVIGVFLCLAFCVAGGVFAYLISKTGTLTNRFIPAAVTCSVEENFENGIKSNVKVRNTGNVDAYVRVAVVATFQTEGGQILSTAPTEGVDYTVTWAANGWSKGADGFWYYCSSVAPDQLTETLIETATVLSAPDGARLNLQIIASALQANPTSAVESAWGITPVNGELFPN